MAEREKIAFIINPKSGTASKKLIPDQVLEAIDQKKYEPVFHFTKEAGHATRLAEKCVKENIKKIIAVGGDGTVNEVAKALVQTQSALGIIPGGSGNGLARHLGIPLKTQDAISMLNRCMESSIDYGTINDHPFFCTCGVGFDAHIGNRFSQSKSRGFYTYVKETIYAFFHYRSKKYKVKIDDQKFKNQAFMITVANAGQYGNDAYISPSADIRDGLLDVCILSPFPKMKAFDLGIRLFKRNIDKSEYVDVIKGKKVTITRKKKGEVHLDGEPATMGKKLKIKIEPLGLKVLVPNK
ncbi:MAG: diacylglycerol kinase family lipid kinase [Bacteroidetes bacterium]|nr:diacylglycerol kinase family lipid kinase [Bacteroidota bacterium]